MRAVNGIVVAAALLVGLATGYVLRGTEGSPPAPPAPGASIQKALYWFDPMKPDQHFDKPGKSPFMDMQLVPKYADEAGADGSVGVDARTAQNLGLRTAPVERVALASALTVAGSVAYDDSAVDVVQARTRGFIERVHVRKPLTHVVRGQPLADLVAPEWSAAEAEYLAVRGMRGAGTESLQAAARRRLVVLGVPEAEIRSLSKTGAASAHVTLVAPRDGIVSELDARQGQAVDAGMSLFRINALSTVWVNAEVPERQSAGILAGAPVSVSVTAYPGRTFAGSVAAVLPQVDATTRTLRVRIELDNADGALAPGMFASVHLASPSVAAGPVVPSEAVIRTGTRTVVIVAEGNGRFRPVDVTTGVESNGRTQVLAGLDEAASVVVSGQFLIDSEANLRGSLDRMSAPDTAGSSR